MLIVAPRGAHLPEKWTLNTENHHHGGYLREVVPPTVLVDKTTVLLVVEVASSFRRWISID
jgi:hypothetical protein